MPKCFFAPTEAQEVHIFVHLSGSHNCNTHQSEGRVGIFKYNLQMQVKGAFFASYLQTAGYDA